MTDEILEKQEFNTTVWSAFLFSFLSFFFFFFQTMKEPRNLKKKSLRKRFKMSQREGKALKCARKVNMEFSCLP